MTDIEMVIKIAEHSGLVRTQDGMTWLSPSGSRYSRFKVVDGDSIAIPDESILPDYLSDLNAMHEAEKFLTSEQQDKYGMNLTDIMSDNARSPNTIDYCDWHATARQKAEAFIRSI